VVHKLELHGSQALQVAADNLDTAGMDVVHADSTAGLDLVGLAVVVSFSCALARSGHPP
jgi:hypothetical protein